MLLPEGVRRQSYIDALGDGVVDIVGAGESDDVGSTRGSKQDGIAYIDMPELAGEISRKIAERLLVLRIDPYSRPEETAQLAELILHVASENR